MATSPSSSAKMQSPLLSVNALDVYYGQAHALQEVSLTLDTGCMAVVGRNGMGKTTLCNAITGMVPARGSVRFEGKEMLGQPAHTITRRGIGYVPQGRRVWPSLTVDEHLRLASSTARKGDWTVERVYDLFPRLAERRGNGGSQLSGGEQQMLAISRALLFNPKLLVMDEPTEGLAPVIVEHVANTLRQLAHEGGIAILLIEQNLGVALEVADNVGVMVNGRLAKTMPANVLAADTDLQQRLLGVQHSGADDEESEDAPKRPSNGDLGARAAEDAQPVRIFTVRRAHDDAPIDPTADPLQRAAAQAPREVRNYNRWNAAGANRSVADVAVDNLRDHVRDVEAAASAFQEASQSARVVELPVAASTGRAAYIAGTFDTKGRELFYLKSCIEKVGVRVVTVDLSTSGKASPASVSPRDVARFHPKGERGVFTGDRGSAVSEMALAFERFIVSRRDVGGVISAGGSGGTAIATPAMRALPIGVPKVMVSTVASGDVKPYVGPADICMMYSVTDVSGINRISERVLANAAHALAGMIAHPLRESSATKPSIGLTMFGVTTTCVQAVAKALENDYDPVIFHATGTGGQSFEKLAESNLFAGVLDLTTTEICDELVGGVLSAGPQRMDAFIHTRLPYVGSVGACDMVNWWAIDTVPAKFKSRNLYKHNPNVTLMRTTVDENVAVGKFIVDKLNRMEGPVRFLLPMGGVSALDAPDKAFHDPNASGALFSTIESGFRKGPNRQLIKVPHHINDTAFAEAAVAAFQEIVGNSQAMLRRA
jgi:uncharacterized protein (UPF0261 family)/ABC-type branched-subunit amino acid transport system ATPase component